MFDLLPLVDVFIGNELRCARLPKRWPRERSPVRTGGRATPSEQEPTADETWTAMGALLEAGAPLVVTTRGPHGAMAAAATGERWTQETIATTVVDTTGAGDAFAAGFLFGWVGGGGQDGAAAAQSDRVCLGLSYGCAAGVRPSARWAARARCPRRRWTVRWY